MKTVLLAALLLFICVQSYQQSIVTRIGKRVYPVKAADNTLGFDPSNLKPGDTLVLKASQNPYSWVSLTNVNSITIINEGGQVVLNWFNNGAIPGGFLINGCKHLHLTGTGVKNIKYGFLVTTPANRGVGVDVYGRSAWIEVDHCEMYNKNAGFWVKEEQADAACDPNLSFPKWVLHDFKLHDNYIHNTSAEGMYLGSTAPNGFEGTQHPSVYCTNGRGDSLLPMRLGNFYIYNNVFDSLSRGAIQLSGADSGMSNIYGNKITNVGYEYNNQQGNGIVLGGYTSANVHDNTISHTYASGIFSLGAGWVTIHDNKVDYSGYLNGRISPGFANIEVDTRQTNHPSPGKWHNPQRLTFIVKNNQLGTNTDLSIRVYNTYNTFTDNNIICNNTIINTNTPATIAINVGVTVLNCSGKIISKAAATTLEQTFSAFPNPTQDVLHVNLPSNLTGKISLSIYNVAGVLLQTKNISKVSGGTNETLNVQSLSAGLYILQILSGDTKTNLKFIKE
ncbi:MAG TPA: T9SS type A sorting domain-containing protein [Parafilimonas sp.]|nr:T9SS type A sorting domain-containing protein [Parafilimonas sp.]